MAKESSQRPETIQVARPELKIYGQKKLRKYLRKEAQHQLSKVLPEHLKSQMVELGKMLRPRPKIMPKWLWKLVGRIYFKVELPE